MQKSKALDTIGLLRDGLLVDELDDALSTVVGAVRASGKPGKVTLTLTIKAVKQGKGEIVAIDDDVKAKLPPSDKGGTLLYSDDAGTLTRDNPKQPRLPLREPAAFPTAASVRLVEPLEAPAATGTDAASSGGKD